jgi:CHAD domain-containing protein
MDSVSLQKKLKSYRKYVKEFIQNKKDSAQDIHDLRVKSRELFSFISKQESSYKALKRVIKLSNNVRDLDVFYKEYIKSLPAHLYLKLDKKKISQSLQSQRKKDIKTLHRFLQNDFTLPQSINFIYEEKGFDHSKIEKFSKKKLHKYRIYIKKKLYKEKNSYPMNKAKVNTLGKIKDILGTINDNNNGYKRLKSYESVDEQLLKEIKKYTKRCNKKLFEEFKLLNRGVT